MKAALIMLAVLVAIALQSGQGTAPPGFHVDADIEASLVRGPDGGWNVRLTGPATPSNWTADPDSLQLSLAAVGDEPGGLHPTLDFLRNGTAVAAAPVKDSASSEVIFPVTLSTGSSGPGFVRLRASGFALCTDPQSQKMISLPVRANDDMIYLSSLVVAPKLDPGLRFFYLPSKPVDLKLEDGTPVPFEQGELHELRLDSIEQKPDGGFHAQFKMEGLDKPVFLDGTGDPLHIPGLPAIVWEDAVNSLRAKYLNKRAWVYGGTMTSVSTFPDEWAAVRIGIAQPIVIRKIIRLYTQHVALNVGPQIAALGGETRSSFYADCPLYVLADIGERYKVTAAMGNSADDMSKMLARKVKLTGFQVVADEWQFERTFSLKSAIEQHPDWSAETFQSAEDGKVHTGMSHAMVAWALGWPCEPSSKKSLMRAPTWRYDIVKPYSYWVEFQGDKVVKFGEDGGKPTHKS